MDDDYEVDDDSTDALEVDESVRRPVRYKLHHKKYRVLQDVEYPETIQESGSEQDDYMRAQDVIDYMKQQKIDYLFEPMEQSLEYRQLRRTIPNDMFQKLNRHLQPLTISSKHQSIRRV